MTFLRESQIGLIQDLSNVESEVGLGQAYRQGKMAVTLPLYRTLSATIFQNFLERLKNFLRNNQIFLFSGILCHFPDIESNKNASCRQSPTNKGTIPSVDRRLWRDLYQSIELDEPSIIVISILPDKPFSKNFMLKII